MRKTVALVLFVAGGCGLAPSGVSAQETAADAASEWPTALREGRWGLSFGLFEGGAARVGFQQMTSPRGAFTFEFSGSAETTSRVEEGDSMPTFEHSAVNVQLSLRPGIRRYLEPGGSTASFGFVEGVVGVSGWYNESSGRESRQWSPMAGAAGGLGIEWFVTDALSLRGEAGVSALYSWYNARTDDPVGGDRETRVSSLRFGLYRSGIAATIHF